MKNLNPKFQRPNSNEAGVTLLLAVLILASLTLSALAIAGFAVQEIRASRAVALAEPAISAAETAGEQGLWAIKRNSSLINCTAGLLSQNLGTNTVVSSCKSYGTATFALQANTPFVFYLYDPNNINGDIDLSGFPYSWLSVNHRAGGFQVAINITRITGEFVASAAVNPSANQTVNIPAVSTGSEGRMKVVLTSTGNATVDVNTNQGMPDFPTVDAIGCSSRSAVNDCNANQELYSRRINVIVPQ